MSTEYQRGYLDGYRDVTTPDDAPTIGEQEAERQTFAEALGECPANEELVPAVGNPESGFQALASISVRSTRTTTSRSAASTG